MATDGDSSAPPPLRDGLSFQEGEGTACRFVLSVSSSSMGEALKLPNGEWGGGGGRAPEEVLLLRRMRSLPTHTQDTINITGDHS